MTRPHLRALLAALALAAAAAARGDGGFSTTNVQFLYGWKLNDPLYDTGNGPMQTLTLNHFDAFGWGDSFFFADLYRADFKNGSQGEFGKKDDASLYAEWHPRLFVNSLLGQKGPALGFIRNWGLAGEINQGEQFYAYLGGVGFDFVAPPGWVLGLNVYYRYDRFAYHQWQVSPFWTVPFSLGPVPFVFTGFVDVNGSKDGVRKEVVEIWAQPELLVDVLAPFGGPKGKLHVGCEWWYHRAPNAPKGTAGVTDASMPQAMVQWTIY